MGTQATLSKPQAAHMSGSYGAAWLSLCFALAVHVTDEAVTGFLSVYNPTVLAVRQVFPNFPMPLFTFGTWLAGLITLVTVLFALSPFAFRGQRWLRYIAWPFAVIMLLNGLGHIAGTIFGQTVSSVRFSRPMPGFYSSPLLLVASTFLIRALTRTSASTAALDRRS